MQPAWGCEEHMAQLHLHNLLDLHDDPSRVFLLPPHHISLYVQSLCQAMYPVHLPSTCQCYNNADDI